MAGDVHKIVDVLHGCWLTELCNRLKPVLTKCHHDVGTPDMEASHHRSLSVTTRYPKQYWLSAMLVELAEP